MQKLTLKNGKSYEVNYVEVKSYPAKSMEIHIPVKGEKFEAIKADFEKPENLSVLVLENFDGDTLIGKDEHLYYEELSDIGYRRIAEGEDKETLEPIMGEVIVVELIRLTPDSIRIRKIEKVLENMGK